MERVERKRQKMVAEGQEMLRKKREAASLKKGKADEAYSNIDRFVTKLEAGVDYGDALRELGLTDPDALDLQARKTARRGLRKKVRRVREHDNVQTVLTDELDTLGIGAAADVTQRAIDEEVKLLKVALNDKTALKTKMAILDEFGLNSVEDAKALRAAISNKDETDGPVLNALKVKDTCLVSISLQWSAADRDFSISGLHTHPAICLAQFFRFGTEMGNRPFNETNSGGDVNKLTFNGTLKKVIYTGDITYVEQRFCVIDGTRESVCMMRPLNATNADQIQLMYPVYHNRRIWGIALRQDGNVFASQLLPGAQEDVQTDVTALGARTIVGMAPFIADWETNYVRVSPVYYGAATDSTSSIRTTKSIVLDCSESSWAYWEVSPRSNITGMTLVVECATNAFKNGAAAFTRMLGALTDVVCSPEIVYQSIFSDCRWIMQDRASVYYLTIRSALLRQYVSFWHKLFNLGIYMHKNGRVIPQERGSKRALLKKLLVLYKAAGKMKPILLPGFGDFITSALNTGIKPASVNSHLHYFTRPDGALIYYLAESSESRVSLYSAGEMVAAVNGLFQVLTTIPGIPSLQASLLTEAAVAEKFESILKPTQTEKLTVYKPTFVSYVNEHLANINNTIGTRNSDLTMTSKRINNLRASQSLYGTREDDKIRLAGQIEELNRAFQQETQRLQEDIKKRDGFLAIESKLREELTNEQLMDLVKTYEAMGGYIDVYLFRVGNEIPRQFEYTDAETMADDEQRDDDIVVEEINTDENITPEERARRKAMQDRLNDMKERKSLYNKSVYGGRGAAGAGSNRGPDEERKNLFGRLGNFFFGGKGKK